MPDGLDALGRRATVGIGRGGNGRTSRETVYHLVVQHQISLLVNHLLVLSSIRSLRLGQDNNAEIRGVRDFIRSARVRVL